MEEQFFRILGNKIPAVEFNNVSLTYAGGWRSSLDNISLRQCQDRRLELLEVQVLENRTLVNLIPRFYDVTEVECRYCT